MTLQWPNGSKVIVSEIVLWPYTIISGHVSNIRLWSPLSRFSPWRVSKKNKSYIVVALHCCSNDWLGKVPDYKQSLLFDVKMNVLKLSEFDCLLTAKACVNLLFLPPKNWIKCNLFFKTQEDLIRLSPRELFSFCCAINGINVQIQWFG